MPPVRVVIRRAISPGGLFRARINGRRLKFGPNSLAAVQLMPGREYILDFYVAGPPGTQYAVDITRPPSIGYSHKNTLDASSKDFGYTWFLL